MVVQSQGSDSIVVSLVSFHIKASLNFPHPHCAVPTRAQYEVSAGHELYATHIVVVPVQGTDAFRLFEVPQLYSQVSGAGSQDFPRGRFSAYLIDRFCVPFQSFLVRPRFIVSKSNGAVFACRGQTGIKGVEGKTSDRLAVSLELVPFRQLRQHAFVALGKLFSRHAMGQFLLQLLHLLLELHDFFLQPHHRVPLFFQNS